MEYFRLDVLSLDVFFYPLDFDVCSPGILFLVVDFCFKFVYRCFRLHSVLVWLIDSLGGKHTPVSFEGSHAVGSCRSRWS